MGTTTRALMALLFVAATPAAAQQAGAVVQESPAWLGISYELQWLQEGGSCTPQVVVEGVVRGSPAARAGLRAGDAIIALDGRPIPGGRLEAVAARLSPGDSLRLRVRRDGTAREVTAVADRRPDHPLRIFVEPSSGFRASSAPVIHLDGETLIARNIGTAWDPGRTRSYWLSLENGRAELRTISGWSRTELDRRVVDLLACADSVRTSDVALVTPDRAGNLQRVQRRADSLRVLITRRTLEREGPGIRITPETGHVVASSGSDRPASVQVIGPQGGYVFRVEDHMAVGLRGVAGAEVTALEPELAAYFRNVDQGLLVLRIAPDTPADRAGLRPGDVVVAADGRRVESVAELRRLIALPGPDAIDLRVVRRGRTRDLALRRN